MPSSSRVDSLSYYRLRFAAKRVERYAPRVKAKIWTADLIGALSDIAETGEIARRLYGSIQSRINSSSRSRLDRNPLISPRPTDS
jgi:hypothetical protein